MDHLGTQEKLDPKERNGECNELKILHSGKLMKALRLSATSASVVIFPRSQHILALRATMLDSCFRCRTWIDWSGELGRRAPRGLASQFFFLECGRRKGELARPTQWDRTSLLRHCPPRARVNEPRHRSNPVRTLQRTWRPLAGYPRIMSPLAPHCHLAPHCRRPAADPRPSA